MMRCCIFLFYCFFLAIFSVLRKLLTQIYQYLGYFGYLLMVLIRAINVKVIYRVQQKHTCLLLHKLTTSDSTLVILFHFHLCPIDILTVISFFQWNYFEDSENKLIPRADITVYFPVYGRQLANKSNKVAYSYLTSMLRSQQLGERPVVLNNCVSLSNHFCIC